MANEPAAGVPPFWRTALIPLPLLLFAGGLWTYLNIDTKVGLAAAIITAASGALAWTKSLWKLADERFAADFLHRLKAFLESRRVARVSWLLLAVFTALSLFVTTIHVETDDKTPNTTLTRVDQDRGEGAAPRFASLRAVHGGDHLIFFMVIPPTGRTVWLTSATGLQSDSRQVRPWLRTMFRFPAHFDAVVTLSLLPAGGEVIQALARDTAGLRLVVLQDTAAQDTIADVRLTSTRGLSLAFGQPAPADSVATRTRWSALAMSRLGYDADRAAAATQGWWPLQHVNARRRLHGGERFRFVLLDPAGVAIRSDTFTLQSPSTDAFLHKHP